MIDKLKRFAPRTRIGQITFSTVATAIVVIATVGLGAPAVQAATTGIFPDTTTPGIAADPDKDPVELGVRFSPQQSGQVTALQYYQGSKATGVTSATLWSSTGAVLARASFTATTTPGWRTVALKSPVSLAAGTTYVASYHAPNGGYPVAEGDLLTDKVQNGFTLKAGAGVYRYGSTEALPTSTYKGSNYLVDIVYVLGGVATSTVSSTTAAPTVTSTTTKAPTSTSTTTKAPTSTPAPTTSSSPPGSCPTYRTIPVGPKPAWGCWPTPDTVGVPKNITLTPYTGAMAVQTAGTVIDSKIINGELRILAANVTIRNSLINGSVRNDLEYFPGSFTLTDTTIKVPNGPYRGLQEGNFVATRVLITGGASGGLCVKNCTIQDSYVVGGYVDNTGVNHMSGFRMETDGVFRRNVIGCDAPDIAPDAGCSAGLTGYGDFQTVQNNILENNLFLPGGGYCTYGGSSGQGGGKPYPNAHDIRFMSNRYVRGDSGKCGFWGPITSFDSAAPGNVWQDNLYYPDGASVPPAN